MRIHPSELDWNLLRAFQATVSSGSLSAAARGLGLSQPTLSRQIAALEASLDVTLFDRVGKKLALTEAGRALAVHADAMYEAAGELALSAAGQAEALEGRVVLSASDAVCFFVLPPILSGLREAAPMISLDVIASNALSDLRKREADIAIRHVRPEEPELVGRWVRDATAGFFAARGWVERHGHPKRASEARGVAFMGGDAGGRFGSYLRELGLDVGPSSFPLRTESSLVAWQFARQGLGVAPIMHEIARGMPDLIEVLEELPTIRFPIWLVTHREVQTSRRIRLVFDYLCDALRG